MTFLFTLYEVSAYLVQALIMLIIVQFVISLLFTFNVISPGNQFASQVYDALRRLLDPIYAPIRRLLPDTGALDLAPMVVIIGLNVFLIIFRDLITSVAY